MASYMEASTRVTCPGWFTLAISIFSEPGLFLTMSRYLVRRLRRRTPPNHVQGTAVTTSAIGYQVGPRFIGIVVIAPAKPAANPMTARTKT